MPIKHIQLLLIFAGGAWAANVNSIPPLHISANADLTPPGSPTGCKCVSAYNGATAVIGPWSISSAKGTDGVFVENVTAPFVLQNLTVTNSGGAGVHLKNINPASPVTVLAGVQTSLQNNSVGVFVESSSNLILDGGGANPHGPGVGGSAGTINKNHLGAIDVENSSSITVKGWQLSANGQDGSPDWLCFDPALPHWEVGGVRFLNVASSIIDHNAANNDTSASYSLFASSGNSVTWNTGDYPFTTNLLVTLGSSNNTIDQNQFGTADFVGILVADPLPGCSVTSPSHDNVISHNAVHSSGPTGNERKAGTSPDFLGGIVLLNGTANNQVIGNNAWANNGGDLKWVQATPAATPIGVRTFPASLAVCNVTIVTVPAPFNGNTWSGNLFQNEDVCPSGPLQP